MVISLIMTAWLAFTLRNNRRVLYFAVVSLLFALTALLVSRFGNVPINIEIKQWAITAPPPDWMNTMDRWEMFHYIRAIAALGSFVFSLIAFTKYAGVTRSGTTKIESVVA
jgi:uncharacterized membrane protein